MKIVRISSFSGPYFLPFVPEKLRIRALFMQWLSQIRKIYYLDSLQCPSNLHVSDAYTRFYLEFILLYTT